MEYSDLYDFRYMMYSMLIIGIAIGILLGIAICVFATKSFYKWWEKCNETKNTKP